MKAQAGTLQLGVKSYVGLMSWGISNQKHFILNFDQVTFFGAFGLNGNQIIYDDSGNMRLLLFEKHNFQSPYWKLKVPEDTSHLNGKLFCG